MTDDEYNRIFGIENNSATKWTLFLVTLICALIVASFALAEEECLFSCNDTAYRLELNGEILEEGLSVEDCVEMHMDLEPQTPAFSRLLCVEYAVARQKI